MMLSLSLFSLVLYSAVVLVAWGEIYDPLNVFCGPVNCYDLLNVTQEATVKDIKKSFRRLSVFLHPDKNKDENATAVFRSVSKAYEVLTGNESRPLFDYYLAHPRDYYKVSGQHYYQALPKADVKLVLIVVVALISWLMHSVQAGKHARAVNYLKTATLGNLPLKAGGSKQTMELYRRASELYDEQRRARGDKKGSGKKDDPHFLKCVDQVVGEVQIEGGYRKPVWRDLFAYQLLISPYTLYLWGARYHRRYVSSAPLGEEDRMEMARDRIGLGAWEEMSSEERAKFIAMEIWKDEVFDKWTAEQEALLEQMQTSTSAKNRKKGAKALRRRGNGSMRVQDDEDEQDGYVD